MIFQKTHFHLSEGIFIYLCFLILFKSQRMWEEQEEHKERKATWCSWEHYLMLIFVLNGVIWFIALLTVQPEPPLSTLVVPSTPLFHIIHIPGKNIPYLYTMKVTNKNMNADHFSDNIGQLQSTVNAMVERIQSLDKLLFQHNPNVTGLVLTCKFGPMCLANLHHLFDNMNISLPVGLCFFFPTPCFFFLMTVFILCFAQ